MEKLDKWLCPVCNGEMILTQFPNPSGRKPGFKLQCKGSDAVPHRLRIFLEGFRADVSFLPAPKIATENLPRNSRSKELLERAARLANAA